MEHEILSKIKNIFSSVCCIFVEKKWFVFSIHLKFLKNSNAALIWSLYKSLEL